MITPSHAGRESASWRVRYRPCSSARAARVGDRTLWFSERSQQIRELNETAALIWQALAAGLTPAAVSQTLVGRGAPRADADSFVASLLSDWVAAGELQPDGVIEPAAHPISSRTLAIGDLTLRLDFHGDADVDAFDAVFGQFQVAGDKAEAVFHLIDQGDVSFLVRDGESVGAAARDGVIPLLKAAFTNAFVHSVRQGFVTHAACLRRGGRAWLLTGPSGTGKTTLCAALTRSGFGYAADDVTLIEAEGDVRGIPFALALKSGAWPLCAELFPELAAAPIHRRADGQGVRYLPPTQPQTDRMPLGVIVALVRDPGAPPRLEDVAPVDALTTLLAESFSPLGSLLAAQFASTAQAVANARCVRMVYSDLDQAADLLAGLAP